MASYVQWVSDQPLLSAAVQFGILGTLGEVVSHWLRHRRIGGLPCRRWQLGAKVLAWAVLGVVIKTGFVGMKGFAGIERAWWTLIWFWIPAHTLTFSLPREYQIGLAALWGLVLGIILGASVRRQAASASPRPAR